MEICNLCCALQSYFAEVYLGSAGRVNEIRSNNDKYLLNKLVQGDLIFLILAYHRCISLTHFKSSSIMALELLLGLFGQNGKLNTFDFLHLLSLNICVQPYRLLAYQ